MAEIRFDGQVAIVTGAGGGLGKQHALELARRGAKVVVNDLGGSMDGSGGSSAAAEAVVAEIKAMGGEAIANGSSVTDDAGVALMVKQAMDTWGRIDVLIANAGILRDKSFSKMEIADFELVLNVHLNAISPVAATRMTENLMPPEALARLKPEYVTPGVVYLASKDAPTGAILTAGGGAFALSRIYETEGVYLGDGGLSVEEVRDNWSKISDPEGHAAYQAGGEQGGKFFRKLAGG